MTYNVFAPMAEVCPVILFYKYVLIADPTEFASAQRTLCSSLGLKGRVLIASEGINGTLAGPAEAVNQYVAALQDARFTDVAVKVSAGDTTPFPKLGVKVRREIVTLNAHGPWSAPNIALRCAQGAPIRFNKSGKSTGFSINSTPASRAIFR